MAATVDAAAFVTEWLETANGRRLPGEEGGCSVFAIQFWDGCRYFGVTDMSILEAVDDLVASPFLDRRSLFASDHCGQMGYVVRCVEIRTWLRNWRSSCVRTWYINRPSTVIRTKPEPALSLATGASLQRYRRRRFA